MARLNIAMLGEQAQEKQQVDSELEVVGNQVEDSLQQAQQAQVEIDQISGAADDAQQATEDLMQEAQAAEQAKELPTQQQQVALESIQRNVKNILKDIGLSASRGFAMESRKGDSKVALEGVADDIKSFIKKIWDKIKEVWNRVVDAIKGFLKNIFDAGSRLKKRAIKVKEAAKAVDGKEPKETTFDAPESVKNYMRSKNNPISSKLVKNELMVFNKTNNDMIDKAIGISAKSKYEKEAPILIMSLLENTKEAGDRDAGFVKSVSPFFTDIVGPTLKGARGNFDHFSDNYIEFSNEDASIKISKITNFKDITDKHDVMKISEINEVCDTVIKQMTEYDNLDKSFDYFKNFIDGLKKKFDEGMMDEGKERKEGFVKTKLISVFMQKMVSKIMNFIKDIATKVRLLDLNVNKAAIDWCAASLKQY